MIDARWQKGPRVRVDAMKRGDAWIDIQGSQREYLRADSALSGAHHMKDGSVYAGCAEGALLARETQR